MACKPATDSPAMEDGELGLPDLAGAEVPGERAVAFPDPASGGKPDAATAIPEKGARLGVVPETGPSVFFVHLEPYSSNLGQTLALAEALAREDWDVHILCRPSCQLAGMAAPLRISVDAAPEGKGMIAAWRLLRLLRKNGVNKRRTALVHACDPTASQVVSLAWRMNKKLRIAHTRRMPIMEVNRKVLRSYQRPSAKIITDSLAGKIALRLSGLEPHLLHTIACGIDPSRQPVRRDRGDGRTIFAITGELTPLSGHSMLFDALPALEKLGDLPSWEVRVFGGGPQFMALMEEAKAKNVLGHLAFFSGLDPAEHLCHCDILVLPASDGESHMPLILQGWAARVPIITINRLDHAEILHGEGNCLLVQSGDVAGLASQMARLAGDRALREHLVEGGRASLAKYPLQAMVAEHKRLFGHILA